MNALTAEQQLRVCELIWPNKRWCIRKGHVHLRLGRQAGVYIPDLTSHKAVGAMVAWLMERKCRCVLHQFNEHHALAATMGASRAKADDWRGALALLVLEVAGNG